MDNNPPPAFKPCPPPIETVEQTAPVRVVIDVSGGMVHAVYANVPAEVILYDTEDQRPPRASIPSMFPWSTKAVWASLETAVVMPIWVDGAFGCFKWID